jgi:hypothetical protein
VFHWDGRGAVRGRGGLVLAAPGRSYRPSRSAARTFWAASGGVLFEAGLALPLVGHILIIVDYHLQAVSPLTGHGMPMMRIGQHLADACFADVITAAGRGSRRCRAVAGSAALVTDRAAVPGERDGDGRRLRRLAAAVGELA